MNPSTLSNIIRNGFAPIRVLKCHKLKHFGVIFHLIKYYQKSKSTILIMCNKYTIFNVLLLMCYL